MSGKQRHTDVDPGPLEGVKIAAVAATRAACYAARLLCDLGATVSIAQTESRDRMSRWLTRGMSHFQPESLSTATALSGCSAIIEDLPLDSALREQLSKASCSVVSLSWYGRTGAVASAPGSDVACQAWSGVADTIGELDRPPRWLPHRVGEYYLGAHAAAAVLAALVTEAETAHIDISLSDVWTHAVGTNGMLYSSQGIDYVRAGRRAPGSGGPYPYGLFSVIDGQICLIARSSQDWERLVMAMGSPAWTTEPRYKDLVAMGGLYPDEVDDLLLPWLKQRTRKDLMALAREYGFPCAPVRKPEEVLMNSDLLKQGFWTSDESQIVLPGSLFRSQTWIRGQGSTVRSSGSSPGTLDGWRILDFSWVWAGPMVGAFCSDLGADVIKVEHETRLDNVRLRGRPLRDGVPVDGDPRELDPYFHTLNRGKRSFTVDLKSVEGRALVLHLVRHTDVLIESFSPGVMERLGLDYSQLRRAKPDIILLSMRGTSLMGERTPSYAPIISSLAGLESTIAYDGEPPVGGMAFGFSDPNASVHAFVMLLAAMWRRRLTGEGAWIRLSQLEALCSVLPEMYSRSQGEQPADGLDGILRCKDGFVAVSLSPNALTTGSLLHSLIVKEVRTTDKRSTMSKASMLDALENWTRSQSSQDCATTLRRLNVPAQELRSVSGHSTSSHVADRRLLTPAVHPQYGPELLYAMPWRTDDLMFDVKRSAPLLGEHTEIIARELLGLTEAQIEELVDRRILT